MAFLVILTCRTIVSLVWRPHYIFSGGICLEKFCQDYPRSGAYCVWPSIKTLLNGLLRFLACSVDRRLWVGLLYCTTRGYNAVQLLLGSVIENDGAQRVSAQNKAWIPHKPSCSLNNKNHVQNFKDLGHTNHAWNILELQEDIWELKNLSGNRELIPQFLMSMFVWADKRFLFDSKMKE